LDENLGLYHTYDEMTAELTALAAAYPAIAELDTMGTSIEGRYLLVLKISDNVSIDEEEPEVLIMGCHHARELMTVEVCLYLADHLLSNYGSDPGATELVDGREIWIAPMINPDGHVYVQNNHSDSWWDWWRKNRRDNGDGTFGVDLNRNYGYMWGYDNSGSSPTTSSDVYRGAAPFSEPETQAVRDFCIGREFTLSLSYHTYGELILYPWGYEDLYTDDHELFVALSDSMNAGLGYTAERGYDLYPTNGDTDDWTYGEAVEKNPIFGYTVEMNTYEEGGFGPPESLILPTCEKLLPLNLTLLRLADDPERMLGPDQPYLYAVTPLAAPHYQLSWSGGDPADPNRAQSYEVVEMADITAVVDSCDGTGGLWELAGFTVSSARAAEGAYSYYSGIGNNMENSMVMATAYPASLQDTIECMLWYDIEYRYDYAYLEASLDQGYSWITIPGDRTSTSNPYGNNRGAGITGTSGAWVPAKFFLSRVGITPEDIVMLRFAYSTDQSVTGEGIYVDLIDPTAVAGERTVLAAAHPDTFFTVTPTGLGEYLYQVRGIDIDGQRSLWSNIVTYTVMELTPAVTPGFASGLEQNYPNPFNPVTNIRFSVGEAEAGASGTAPVLVELYDVAGRRIATLKDAPLPSGEYSIAWNGMDARGCQVASGVYFLRLQVGQQAFSRKMVLLR
ncbi:MAG TPA: T9SS type A sorting domain-containing protein, partial [Candidatus Eisenbacteria bacterium]|nr:T9SS type A sorting domain-containing protein [Candidatus Eisenbacteria bacterium]